jgi:acetate kinase
VSSRAILTLNAGSSSIKFALFEANGDALIASGMVDKIGKDGSLRLSDAAKRELPVPATDPAAFADHAASLRTVLDAVDKALPGLSVDGVGHRVVHGGIDFAEPVLVSDTVLRRLDELCPFAPLHQPHNLAGIRAAVAEFPGVPQVACFDTAFHRNHPFVNDTFGLPRPYYDKGVRRYGFHGLSYEYVAGELAAVAPAVARGRVVIAHLGNGASMCGLFEGRSIASTMGFTALDGLAMGTRCGQLDPGVVLYLLDQEGLTVAEIADLLYTKSGLIGMSGISNDMRTLEASDSPAAREAIDYFVSRIRRELGSLAAALGGLDALVFTAGIGENSRLVRSRVCEGMEWLRITLDENRNQENARVISTDAGRVTVLVVPTNEELVIARAVRRLVSAGEKSD